MSATPALWTKHRSLAIAISRDFFFPGADEEDVQQEAMIALWVACRSYRADQGASFTTFARTVIERHLSSCLKAATRHKALVLTQASREDWKLESRETQAARDRLWEVVEATRTLTLAERAAVQAYVMGTYDSHDKPVENALYRARRKLRAAA